MAWFLSQLSLIGYIRSSRCLVLQTGLVTSPGELSGSSQPALGPSVLPPMVAESWVFLVGLLVRCVSFYFIPLHRFAC